MALSLVVVEQRLKMRSRLLDRDVSNEMKGMNSSLLSQAGVFCSSWSEFSLVPEPWIASTEIDGLEHFLTVWLEDKVMLVILVL